MKKLITTSNPFALLMLPIALVMVMGINNQLKQRNTPDQGASYNPPTSLFNKGVTLFKTVSGVDKVNAWY